MRGDNDAVIGIAFADTICPLQNGITWTEFQIQEKIINAADSFDVVIIQDIAFVICPTEILFLGIFVIREKG